jgi:hypothetical protein
MLFNFWSYKAQYTISYSQLEIITYSVSITYEDNAFYPDYYYTASALATLQARYDYYHGMINKAWGKVHNCHLINSKNEVKMTNKDIEISNYMISNNYFTHVDWAQNGSYAIKICNWMTSIFNDAYIQKEISLLHAVNSEYYRLKNTYPDDFYKRDRYFELGKALNELKTCAPSEIENISSTYGLY